MYKKQITIVILLIITIIALGTLTGCDQSAGNDPSPTIVLTPVDADNTENVESTVEPSTQVSPLVSPPETPLPPLAVDPGAAGIQGYIGYREEGARGAMIAWFCPFTPNSTGIDGIYILDTSTHPRVEIGDDGWFQAGDIEPGKYVLVVGAEPETSRAIVDVDRPGHTKVFELIEGEILEIAVDASLVTISEE